MLLSASTGNTAQVVVQYQDQVSAPVSVNVTTTAPAIFTLNASGSGQAIAFSAAGALNGADRPAPAGAFLTFYATGVGQTNPPGQDGMPAVLPLPQPTLQVAATIGGKPATVQYAGGAPGIVAGVIQVNLAGSLRASPPDRSRFCYRSAAFPPRAASQLWCSRSYAISQTRQDQFRGQRHRVRRLGHRRKAMARRNGR